MKLKTYKTFSVVAIAWNASQYINYYGHPFSTLEFNIYAGTFTNLHGR